MRFQCLVHASCSAVDTILSSAKYSFSLKLHACPRGKELILSQIYFQASAAGEMALLLLLLE